jgi:hypothetical protein
MPLNRIDLNNSEDIKTVLTSLRDDAAAAGEVFILYDRAATIIEARTESSRRDFARFRNITLDEKGVRQEALFSSVLAMKEFSKNPDIPNGTKTLELRNDVNIIRFAYGLAIENPALAPQAKIALDQCIKQREAGIGEDFDSRRRRSDLSLPSSGPVIKGGNDAGDDGETPPTLH